MIAAKWKTTAQMLAIWAPKPQKKKEKDKTA